MRLFVALSALVCPAAAFADCIVKNETSHSFDLETAGVDRADLDVDLLLRGDRVVVTKRDDGMKVDGVCKEGEHVKIVEEAGKVVIKHDDAHDKH